MGLRLRLSKTWKRRLLKPKLSPPALLASFYLVLILLGAAVLSLPVSHHGAVTVWDALFTSVSAVTVTGLSVVDTGQAFTGFGQGMIALLIQLGGLGLMSFAVLVLGALGLPVGLPHRMMLREDLGQTSVANLGTLVRMTFRVALLCELAGAALLSLVIVPDHGSAGFWHALFLSVSAFNNAGFALWSDSLTQYVGDPVVNLVIPALFILGGLGFVVVADINQKRNWRRLTLHSKLMLVGTAALILWGVVMFGLLEWRNPGTLGPLSPSEKLWASWFQGVSPRTAGFNTVDIGAMHDSTALMTMLLMLVGGGSTSTAGGLKVTTLLVLLLATRAFFRRRSTLHAFGRSLGPHEVMKVMALTTVSMIFVLSAMFVISISHDGEFMDLAFEVTSAFATVGLSRGATADLDTLGRTVVMVLMFFGRVGPLTLGFFLATHGAPRVRYPAGQVYLG
jgi:trk system potassium uptake protein TrkH